MSQRGPGGAPANGTGERRDRQQVARRRHRADDRRRNYGLWPKDLHAQRCGARHTLFTSDQFCHAQFVRLWWLLRGIWLLDPLARADRRYQPLEIHFRLQSRETSGGFYAEEGGG